MAIAGKKDWVVDLLVHWMVQFGLSRGQQLIWGANVRFSTVQVTNQGEEMKLSWTYHFPSQFMFKPYYHPTNVPIWGHIARTCPGHLKTDEATQKGKSAQELQWWTYWALSHEPSMLPVEIVSKLMHNSWWAMTDGNQVSHDHYCSDDYYCETYSEALKGSILFWTHFSWRLSFLRFK